MDNDLSTGELARACSVSADTIRYYERRGALGAAIRGANGYRKYPADAVDRVLLIRRAISLGFSIDEIVEVLRERVAGRPPCRRVRAIAAAKLEELDGRIMELQSLRETVAATIAEWDERLSQTAPGEPAHLLERSLA